MFDHRSYLFLDTFQENKEVHLFPEQIFDTVVKLQLGAECSDVGHTFQTAHLGFSVETI